MSYFAPKSEEEYKEYLKNLLVEYQFACFSEKLGDGCYRLANYHEVIKSDYETAKKIYKISCDEMNYGHACYRYGTFAFLGRGMDKNIEESTNYFERACNLGYTKACHNSGIAYAQGDGCVKNFQKAMEYFKRGCAGSVGESCLSLWSIYFKGRDGEQAKDPAQALEFSAKACELESFQGCVNASLMCRRGDGIPTDHEKAKYFLEKANEIKRKMNDPGVVFGETHKNLE